MAKGNQKKNRQGGSHAGKPAQLPMACPPTVPPAADNGGKSFGPVLEHRFNDDLLISEHDQKLAKAEYPEIYHVLDHPELREQFLSYDGVANKAKLWVHLIGLLAVALAVFALLGSAITPLLQLLLDVPEWVSTALFLGEVGGIVGVVIAGGGMWIAGQKKIWLEARMMAEVLRLWHFQSLICRGKEIESSCDKGNPAEPAGYQAARALQFQAFIREWSGTLDSHLTELIENPEAGYQFVMAPKNWTGALVLESPRMGGILDGTAQEDLRRGVQGEGCLGVDSWGIDCQSDSQPARCSSGPG